MDIHCIVSKLCELDTSPFFTEDTRIKHLRTSVSPRGRFCDGEPEYVIAVVVDAAVVVVAAAIAVVTDGDACCDGSLLGAPPFSPVKIIRGQRERGNDGAIEQWNDGSESRVVNEREQMSETRHRQKLDRQLLHVPAACERVLPATVDALLEAASAAADAGSFSSRPSTAVSSSLRGGCGVATAALSVPSLRLELGWLLSSLAVTGGEAALDSAAPVALLATSALVRGTGTSLLWSSFTSPRPLRSMLPVESAPSSSSVIFSALACFSFEICGWISG